MKKKKYLITGITGFVGSYLAELLLRERCDVYGAKRWRSPMDNIEHIKDKIKLIDWDMNDPVSAYNMIQAIKPDVIFNLAAQSYVPYSFECPISTLHTNICGTTGLFEAIRKNKINPVIISVTSSEVYGEVTKDDVPITEECPLRPHSPYGVSKVGQDLISFQYYRSYGMKIIRTRMFTHVGARQNEGLVLPAFAKQIAMIEAGLQKPTVLVGNLDSVRTFADVRDTVRAYYMLSKSKKYGEVFNIGGDVSMTIGEMLHALLKLSTKSKVHIKVDPKLLRPSDVTLQIPDISKFKKETGWKPLISFEETLLDTLTYWRKKYGQDS